MIRISIFLLTFLCPFCLNAQDNTSILFETTEGNIIVSLFNDTPLHKANFIRKVKDGVYNGRTFNRVIDGFVVQCGEEQDADIIPAEIHYPEHFHRRGAVAMGRCTSDPDHELKSADEQFYFVLGRIQDEAMMHRSDSLMNVWSYGTCTMDDKVRQYYQENPGLPSLDGSYTIFGEVTTGLDIIERIQHVKTDSHNRPLEDITIHKATVLACDNSGKPALYADAWRLAEEVAPTVVEVADSIYTVKDWYGVKGYDFTFKVKKSRFLNNGTEVDSLYMEVLDADSFKNGYYYLKTGLEDLPVATIYPGLFVETNTACSGFYGDKDKGQMFAYTYLYDGNWKWQGGHLYKLMWGMEPEKPIWTVTGKSTLVGNVPGLVSTLEAYSGDRYILRDWYGVGKYDLEFRIRKDGGIEITDYYWVENEERYVQCRREDIGFAAIPQGVKRNGGLKGNAKHGKLHFRMTAYKDDEHPIDDNRHKEFVFEW